MTKARSRAASLGNMRWTRLPLETRQIIVKEVLESSVPIPLDGEQGFQAFRRHLGRTLLINRSFTSDEVLQALKWLVATVFKLLMTILAAYDQVQQAILDELTQIESHSNFLGSRWARLERLADVLKNTLGPIKLHLVSVFKILQASLHTLLENP